MRKAFVNSLPKSGTHLTAKCLRMMGYTEHGHIGSALVLNPGLLSKVRRLLAAPLRQGYLVGVDTPVEMAARSVHRLLRKTKDTTFLTAHVGYSTALLDAILSHGIAPIVVSRDPRSVLTSFSHYVAKREEHVLYSECRHMPLEERFHAALHGKRFRKAYLEPLRIRCLALDGWMDHKDVLHIRFEDLVGAQGGGSDELQKQVLTRICTFLEADESHIPTIQETLFGPGRHTFRKGHVASWREELSADFLEQVNEKIGDIIERWGYKDLPSEVEV